jgi:transmembrane sensor
MIITTEQLTKLREGRCTPDELVDWQAYFKPANKLGANQSENDLPDLGQLLADDWQNLTVGTATETAQAQKRVWQLLEERIEADAVPMRPLNSQQPRRAWQWAVAASVVGVLAVGGWWFWQQQTQPEPMAGIATNSTSDGWLVTTNQTDAPERLTLADGSTVSLLPKSQVRYPARFAGALRTVQLSGEAFFAVRPDKAHPFVVQTRSVLVRVLGTSFTVRDFANQPTAEVAVKTGRVSVSAADGKTGLVLAPNERATLMVASGQVAKTLVVAPDVINPAVVTNRFVFADTPVAEVFGELERAYGVTIRHDRQTLANCTITARLSEQPLFTKLDMICASIGASYRIDGTTVVVQGAGCE